MVSLTSHPKKAIGIFEYKDIKFTGINKALEEDPDLILLDLAMQGLDGFQVLDYLQGRTKVPVIVISALASTDAVAGSLRRGAVAFIRKPFSTSELISVVRCNLMLLPRTLP